MRLCIIMCIVFFNKRWYTTGGKSTQGVREEQRARSRGRQNIFFKFMSLRTCVEIFEPEL